MEWSIDLIGPNRAAVGGSCLLVVGDVGSDKIVTAAPLTLMTGKSVAEALEDAFDDEGLPTRLLMDNSRVFSSEPVRALLKRKGIKWKLLSSLKPSVRRVVERMTARAWAQNRAARVSGGGSLH